MSRKYKGADNEHCYLCGKPLSEQIWLEMDAITGLCYRANHIPEERSQGSFAFGPDCAKRLLAESANA
jgi:hypothetical protein